MKDSLDFAIETCSSFQPGFPPSNIIVNAPTDVQSRWMPLQSDSEMSVVLRFQLPVLLSAFGVFNTCSLYCYRNDLVWEIPESAYFAFERI